MEVDCQETMVLILLLYFQLLFLNSWIWPGVETALTQWKVRLQWILMLFKKTASCLFICFPLRVYWWDSFWAWVYFSYGSKIFLPCKEQTSFSLVILIKLKFSCICSFSAWCALCIGAKSKVLQFLDYSTCFFSSVRSPGRQLMRGS